MFASPRRPTLRRALVAQGFMESNNNTQGEIPDHGVSQRPKAPGRRRPTQQPVSYSASRAGEWKLFVLSGCHVLLIPKARLGAISGPGFLASSFFFGSWPNPWAGVIQNGPAPNPPFPQHMSEKVPKPKPLGPPFCERHLAGRPGPRVHPLQHLPFPIPGRWHLHVRGSACVANYCWFNEYIFDPSFAVAKGRQMPFEFQGRVQTVLYIYAQQ